MSHLQLLPLEEQVALVEQYELDTLLFCHDAWALRHTFTNTQTGETVRARCGSWSCPYCGPRKVDMWRQLVKAVTRRSQVPQFTIKKREFRSHFVLTDMIR